MFSACARMSSFSFHEFQSRVSPLIFHEFQSHVFTLCMHFTAYFSWISGPWFQPLWTISTFIFSYSLTPFHGFMFQSCQIHAPKPAAIPQKKNRSAIQEPTQGLHDARKRSNSCWFDHSWPMHSLSWAGPIGIHVFWPCLSETSTRRGRNQRDLARQTWMVNDACGFHCHSLTRVQKMAESESFNTLLMSMHGPCARMTLIAISSLAVFTLVMDNSCKTHWIL